MLSYALDVTGAHKARVSQTGRRRQCPEGETMSEREEAIRRRAYELWEHAGCPHGRSDEFWHTARDEIEGDGAKGEPFDPFEPPIDEPPEVAFRHGVPVGMPGERIVEQGVLDDDRLMDMIPVARPTPED